NAGKLPEQSQLNITQLSSLQAQAAGINDALNRLAQERVQLDTRLETLQSQLSLLDMFDKDTDTTPMVRRQNERLVMLNRQITETESSLAQLKQVYKANYPDIRDAERRLEVIRKERDELQKQQDEEEAKPREPVKKATSFQQAQSASAVQGQINATKASVQTLQMQRENLEKDRVRASAQMVTYQDRLAATSGIEGQYSDLI